MKGMWIAILSVLTVWTVIAIGLRPKPGPSDLIPLVWSTGANPQRAAQVQAFNDLHPHLYLRADPANTGVMKVVIQSSAGMGPDLIDHITPITAQTYLDAGILWDVTEPARAMGFGPEVLHESVRPLVLLRDWETMEYRQYFFPCNVTHTFLMYNRDHFDRAGIPYPPEDLTWDEYIALARALTRFDPRRPEVPDVFGAAGVTAPLCIWSRGGDILNADGTRCLLVEPGAVAGMQFLHDLYYRHRVEPTRMERAGVIAAGTDFGGGHHRLWFGEQRLSMLLGSRWMLISLRLQFQEQREAMARWEAANPGVPYEGPVPFRIGATLVPRFPDRPRYTTMSARGTGINAMSPHREEALLFLQYLAGETYSNLINEGADAQPGNRAFVSFDRFRHPDWPEEDEAHRMEIASIPYGRTIPLSPFIQAATVSRYLRQATDVVLADPHMTPGGIEQVMKRTADLIDTEIRRAIEREPRMRRIYERLLAAGAEPMAPGHGERP